MCVTPPGSGICLKDFILNLVSAVFSQQITVSNYSYCCHKTPMVISECCPEKSVSRCRRPDNSHTPIFAFYSPSSVCFTSGCAQKVALSS